MPASPLLRHCPPQSVAGKSAAKHSFERRQLVPSTGRMSGRRPAYVVDHVNPLEYAGADFPPQCAMAKK